MRVQQQGALAGRLQAYPGISLGQAHDAQASAVAHLRMRLALQDDPHQFRGGPTFAAQWISRDGVHSKWA